MELESANRGANDKQEEIDEVHAGIQQPSAQKLEDSQEGEAKEESVSHQSESSTLGLQSGFDDILKVQVEFS